MRQSREGRARHPVGPRAQGQLAPGACSRRVGRRVVPGKVGSRAAGKPGSVTGFGAERSANLPATTMSLGPPSLAASNALPAGHSDAGRVIPAYVGFLRVRFAKPARLHVPLVGSYPTVSPLPRRSRELCRGGLFSVALSLALRPADVIRHPALWSPDFPPPPSPLRGGRQRPSRWLEIPNFQRLRAS